MQWWLSILIAVVVVVAIALVAWAMTRRRTSMLRDRFGPEYDRTVDQEGRRAGESELRERVRRREHLDIRPLLPAAAQRYVQAWRDVQARFVDAPSEALAEADLLITSVMRERGYPMDDFEQRSADVSVDHADVVDVMEGVTMTIEGRIPTRSPKSRPFLTERGGWSRCSACGQLA